MQFSKIFLKIIIHNQKSIVKDIRLIPLKKPSFPNQVIKKTCVLFLYTRFCVIVGIFT